LGYRTLGTYRASRLPVFSLLVRIQHFFCFGPVLNRLKISGKSSRDLNKNSGRSSVVDPDPDPEAKMTHENRKSEEISCFEVLDVLF
jgi:hypothetical protein